jgi:hypothetical protein
VVRDLRVARAPVTAEDLAALQTDVLAGFVLARSAAGLSDGTIASDVLHLEQVRAWFGRPPWDMEPPDADAYFGKVLRNTAKGIRLSLAQGLKTYFLLLELRQRVPHLRASAPIAPSALNAYSDASNEERFPPNSCAHRTDTECGPPCWPSRL